MNEEHCRRFPHVALPALIFEVEVAAGASDKTEKETDTLYKNSLNGNTAASPFW